MKNKQKEPFKLDEIIYNAKIIYTDNVKESFEALRVTEKGVIIGRIIEGEFLGCGFISKNVIKKGNIFKR